MLSPRQADDEDEQDGASPGARALNNWSAAQGREGLPVFSFLDKRAMLSKPPESFSRDWITYERQADLTAVSTESPRSRSPSAPVVAAEPAAAGDDPEMVTKAMYYIREAEVKMSAGLVDQAVSAYAQALSVYPQMTYANKQIGRLNLMRGDFEGAIRHLTAALDADETLPETLNDLGVAYLYSGRPHEALASFEAALSADPMTLEPLFNAGLVLRRLMRIDDARAALVQYLETESMDARAHRELALLDTMQTNHTAALAGLERAMELDPAWYTPLLDAALIYAEAGNRDMAMKYLERAMEIAPALVIYQVFTQPIFRNIRLQPESKPFETRLAAKARQEMKQ